MKALKAEELRKLSQPELEKQLQQERERLFSLRQNRATRKLTDSASVPVVRRNIARLLTIISELRQSGA